MRANEKEIKKSPEELFQERFQRVRDAVELKEPDRVPLTPFYHFFPAFYAGLSAKHAMYDYDKSGQALKKTMLEFDFDMYLNPHLMLSFGPLLDILDWKQFKWPVHGVSEESPFQFVEGEYMEPEDYDDFIADPTGYILKTYLPRTYGSLAGLQRLPSFPSIYYSRFLTGVRAFAHPDLIEALEALLKAGKEARKVTDQAVALSGEMTALGYPTQFGATAYAPFDYIGDLYRGTVGILTDIYRRPDKLLELIDKLLPIIIDSAVKTANATGVRTAFIPLHKGIDGFMSLEHFKTFYWPSLERLLLGLIENDVTPLVLWEGQCKSRLEHIRIPKGKAIYWFEQTDLFKAKEVLGDVVCLRGNVPASLMCTGAPAEVTEYCKKLIEGVGKGGGFIMDCAFGIPDEARPENVKAMADATRRYGRYD